LTSSRGTFNLPPPCPLWNREQFASVCGLFCWGLPRKNNWWGTAYPRFGISKFGIPIEIRSLMSAGIGCTLGSRKKKSSFVSPCPKEPRPTESGSKRADRKQLRLGPWCFIPRSRLVVSRSTCPPLSIPPPLPANSFVIGTAVINTHTKERTSHLFG
jgi:hypothetical protein